ncbi:hypothetical protein [Streptomyces sp. RK75]|uniref:hypothetical protein n=1 Tax=Streptomyces sp. RK75 TaxID=2824895 RepID=UPI001B36406B|nr:hypothetical protein [Streptomyces sp. RK75]MBQ0867414.1 hypothetical protein [Streptomyces sp. RK75]
MRTTSRGQERPPAESEREQAWRHLLEAPSGIRHDPYGQWTDEGSRRLKEIARKFDRICDRASGRRNIDVNDTDVLAALLVIRTLRDKLDRSEYDIISLAREKQITWQRIADALEMRSRQAAERRHLQLSRARPRFGMPSPQTQSDRVEMERDRRGRWAEEEWALKRAGAIRRLAQQLAALPDLQIRVDTSRESRIISALYYANKPPIEQAPLSWTRSLRQALDADNRFRTDPQSCLEQEEIDELTDISWRLQRKEAALVHRLLGLLSYAAVPRNLDLSGHADLAQEIRALHDELSRRPR